MSGAPATPFRDLQAFLCHLERRDQLRRVSAPVDKDTELACIARWALESTPPEDAYALLFEQVRGHHLPVAVNVFTPPAAYAAALGAPTTGVLARWADALAAPQPPRPVQDAPVCEVVERGARADLGSLPAPTWTPGRDAGPYLSAAVVITKDPETGVQNLGTYRVQLHDSRRAGLFFGSERQHGAMHLAKYRARGEPMPVALVVGAPPAVCFAAAAKTAYGVDEMDIAGGLCGVPLEVSAAATVDLLVPARAECVIEGLVAPHARAEEGPFGEALGYMNLAAPAAVVEVTAICRRAAAVHHGYVQQLPPSDGHLVMEMGILGPLWFYVTRQLGLQGLCDLAIARGSAGVSVLVAQLARTHAHRAASIGRVLARVGFGQKFIYLVDEDIDIRDPETLTWALSSRVDPERDITVSGGTTTFQLDPSVLDRAAENGTEIGEPPYASSIAIVNATLKRTVPEVSLPGRALMERALSRWGELGLPDITPRRRLTQLLATHSESGLHHVAGRDADG